MFDFFELVETPLELTNSVIEFYEKPEFWKVCLGGGAIYFIHLNNNGKHYFGLSKFSAFNNISVEQYIAGYRHQIGGGKAQKLISRILGKEWSTIEYVDNKIQEAFKNWIFSFYPNYNLEKAHIITIDTIQKFKPLKNKVVTPEELKKDLEQKNIIGKVGEYIAYEFEINRIKEFVRNPNKYIDHISKTNIASGFDIHTRIDSNNERFIEIKSSTSKNSFFLTENEFITLEQLGEKAFIYLVLITNIEKKEGYVYETIQNPIQLFKGKNKLKPVLYKVDLN